jgi:hypothetical protein
VDVEAGNLYRHIRRLEGQRGFWPKRLRQGRRPTNAGSSTG